MAHFQQLQYVTLLSEEFPDFFNNKSVLEIGSWITNGSVRDSFTNCQYVGVDIAEGPGVDLVSYGQDVSFEDDYFDTVISCECFEHNPDWGKTFHNMVRMLKPGGLCIISCATLGRKEHGTKRTNVTASLTALNDDDTGDYYCNLRKEDFEKLFPLKDFFEQHYFFTNVFSRDLYFFGFKTNLSKQKTVSVTPTFIKKINAIKRAKKVSFLSCQIKYLKFWFNYYYALSIGEKKFHDKSYFSSVKKYKVD